MWAILPLKDFSRSKQRLAGVLEPEQRRDLLQAMATDVLQTLQGHPDLAGVLVVSSDQVAHRLACAHDADFMHEAELGVTGLNPVVQAATALLAQRGIGEAMVLHGDLPLMTAQEISVLIEHHQRSRAPSLTLATDRHGDGSNGLLCQTATAPVFGYGKGSCLWHQTQARLAGAACAVLTLPGLAHDIDEPDDLRAFFSHPNASTAKHTRRYLAASGIARQLLARENA